MGRSSRWIRIKRSSSTNSHIRSIRNIRSNRASRKIHLSPNIRNHPSGSRRILRSNSPSIPASLAFQCRHIRASLTPILANLSIQVKHLSRASPSIQGNSKFQGNRALLSRFILDSRFIREHRKFKSRSTQARYRNTPANLRPVSHCRKIRLSRSPFNIRDNQHNMSVSPEVIQAFQVARR